jgi:hypothetical protein
MSSAVGLCHFYVTSGLGLLDFCCTGVHIRTSSDNYVSEQVFMQQLAHWLVAVCWISGLHDSAFCGRKSVLWLLCFIFVVFCLSKYGGKGNLLRPLLYGPMFWKKLQIVIRVRFSSITWKQNISLQWKWLAFLKLKVRGFLHYDTFFFKSNYQPGVLLSMSGMFVCEQCQKKAKHLDFE